MYCDDGAVVIASVCEAIQRALLDGRVAALLAMTASNASC